MLLDAPERCPFYPPLTFDGLAVTATGQHHLLLSTPTVGFYAGPDKATVARRAGIVAAALREGRAQLHPDLAAGVAAWIELCWDSAVAEVAAAIAAPTLEQLG